MQAEILFISQGSAHKLIACIVPVRPPQGLLSNKRTRHEPKKTNKAIHSETFLYFAPVNDKARSLV